MAWALAISLIFVSMLALLTIIYVYLGKMHREIRQPDGSLITIPAKDKHIILRIGILGLIASYALNTVGMMDSLARVSKVTDPALLATIDTTITIVGIFIYIFIAYLVMYVIYYLINKIVENSKAKKMPRIEL